jgi:hypothetical protein
MRRFKWHYIFDIILTLLLLTTVGACDGIPTPDSLPPDSAPRDVQTPSIPTEGLPVIADFYADPVEVMANDNAVLHWSVSGASMVTIEPDVGDVPLSGDKSVRPHIDTTYILTASNEDGSVTARTQVIGYDGPLTSTVEGTPPTRMPPFLEREGSEPTSSEPKVSNSPLKLTDKPSSSGSKDILPMIHSFYADPASILTGSSTKLRWEVFNADTITITALDFIRMGLSSTGSTIASPTTTTEYTLKATNSAGSRNLSVTVNVIKTEKLKTAPSLKPVGLPIIHSFSADPESISAGDISLLSWEVSNADSIDIFGFKDSAQVDSSGSIYVKPSTTYKYSLTATNSIGTSRATVTITVKESTAEQALAPTPKPTPTEANLAERLEKELSGDVSKFQLVKVDVAVLTKDLARGIARLSLVNEKREKVTLELPAQRIQLRDPSLIVGVLKTGKPEEPGIEKVKLPTEQNFRLGETGKEVLDKGSASYGALTIIDEAQTMISGMVIGPSVGVTFFEPVDLILGGRSNPGLHILYNIIDTMSVVFPDEEQPRQVEIAREVPDIVKIPVDPTAATTFKQTKVVLDGDVQFYNIDTSTVWSRQEAIHNAVSLVYEVIEPLSSGTWGLHIPIKGQEVWVSDGPTTTNKDALLNELVDPDYLLINQVEEDELHQFLVGYNVSGVYGKAAGIGNTTGGFGGGVGKNHAYSEARSSQSLKTQWVVMAHELGHLIGGIHGDGVLSGCAGGSFPAICGPSIMPAGSAGAPETRASYFSDANDANISAVINSILSDWP